MTDDRSRRIRDLFEEAIGLEEPARARLLEKTHCEDPSIARELKGLLDWDIGEGDDPTFRPLVGAAPSPALDEGGGPLPERIGPYAILGRLGSGGMGVVYEAEQAQPRRLVALKVMRGGRFADDVQLRLFQREVESLARLDHPGIASIIEAGRADDGLPYFAMELVRGETLDRYAERVFAPERPTERAIERRLHLFLRIVDAVRYAHQRGVVHRDLKPSNILVMEAHADDDTGSSRSAVPRVKVLDFGLARFTEGEGAASVGLTRTGDVRGTLQYMSPEQATGRREAVDVRSDVYALGVLLYQLLTGRTPYRLDDVPMPEALRLICEAPPAKPTLSERGDSLPGDLEAILSQALRKEATHRYQSAHAFGSDIERYLSRQPIEARAPSSFYQLRMMFMRNRTPFVLTGLLIFLLAGFAVAMTMAVERTARARDRARVEAVTAKQVSDFLVDLFEKADPGEAQGRTLTAEELVRRGAERIRTEVTNDPFVRARLLERLGTVNMNLGLLDEAGSLFEEVLAVYEAAGVAVPETLVADGWNDLGAVHLKAGRFEECLDARERALLIRRRVLPPDHPQVATSLNNVANVYSRVGRFAEAESTYLRALEIRERAFGAVHEDIGVTVSNLALLHWRQGDAARALPLIERALAIWEKALGPEHPRALSGLSTLAGVRSDVGDTAGAISALERAVAGQEKVLGPDHHDVAVSLNGLAILYEIAGDLPAAKRCAERALAVFEGSLGPEHPFVAAGLNSLAEVVLREGDPARARSLRERAIGIWESAHGPEHYRIAPLLVGLAQVAATEGKIDEALSLYRRALPIQEARLGASHPDVLSNLEEQARLGALD